MDCISHHPVCKAACCKIIAIPFSKKRSFRKGTVLHVKMSLSDDMKHYYELHGVTITDDGIGFIVGDHRWQGNLLILQKKCRALGDDLLCTLHDTGLKPDVCKDFNEGCENLERYHIPNSCLLHDLVSIGKH